MSAGAARGTARAAGPDLVELLSDRELIVCCGSGGVGKTTVSATLALAMVQAYDIRVIVLTVDPARRLASALGIGAMGVDPVVVPQARLRRAGIRPRGELVAAMLDTKSSWDRLVERHAPSRLSMERILSNPFYASISDAFVGGNEYMAMEELYELHQGREYDLVVVDTPPSRSALDFLEAPRRMSDFVGGRLLSWLARPSRAGWRAVNVAATPFVRIADRLLGSEVLAELAEFVRELQGMYAGVQAQAREVDRLLRSPAAGFVVVTTLEPQPFEEAEFFCTKLREYGMPLQAFVVNRMLPAELVDPAAAAAATAMVEHDRERAAALSTALGERVGAQTVHRLGEAWLTLHRLAVLHERQVARLRGLDDLPVARLALAEHEVVDLEGLAQLIAGLRGRAT
ncbi:MAG TPA: ArsA-related P-loop ATPase [Candidatus Dormibacteraeota bacterium]